MTPSAPPPERYTPPPTDSNSPRERYFRRRRHVAVTGTLLVAGILAFGAYRLAKRVLPSDEELAAVIESDGRDPVAFESVEKKHWQASSSLPSISAEATDAREKNRGRCLPGMVEVRGKSIADRMGNPAGGEIEGLQDATCTDWISRDFPARCAHFDETKWAKTVATLPKKELAYCIDRFEYPNVEGQNPIIVVAWTEARTLCKKSGKRLCTETEWTFACEGEEAAPYPYGFDRDAEACVVDRPWHPFKAGALFPRDGEGAREELERLWQAEPSGSHARCKSPFGVYDLTGNVDEWTISVQIAPKYKSVLKGGYWGPVRARCRPATRAHDENFVAYQQSFRCCGDLPGDDALAADAGPAPTDSPDATATPAPSTTPSALVPTDRADASTPELAVAQVEDDEDEALARKPGVVHLPVSCRGSVAPTDASGAGAAFAGLLLGLAALGRRSTKG